MTDKNNKDKLISYRLLTTIMDAADEENENKLVEIRNERSKAGDSEKLELGMTEVMLQGAKHGLNVARQLIDQASFISNDVDGSEKP